MKQPKPSAPKWRVSKQRVSPEPVNEEETVASAGMPSDRATSSTRVPDEETRESPRESSSETPTRADHSEAAAYEVGVRLQQAIILSNGVAENGSVNLFPDLMNALVRLRTAYDVAITELGPLQGDRDFGRDLLDGDMNQIRPLVRGDHDDVDHSGYRCQRFLESFQRSLGARLLGTTVKGSKASPWFELGLEIVDGYWYDPFDVPPTCPPRAGDRKLVFDHPETVDGLLQQLDLSLSDLLPRELSAVPSIWSDDLPRQLVGWERIEDGLQRLRQLHRTTTDAAPSFVPNNAQQIILDALDGKVLTSGEIKKLPGMPRQGGLFLTTKVQQAWAHS